MRVVRGACDRLRDPARSPILAWPHGRRVARKPAERLDLDESAAESLRAAWDAAADDWIRWAGAPGHDSYWRFHRALFLPIVPAPGRRTLDLGCGEGRLARDLAALGHRVVAVDGSPRMIEAARAAAPGLSYHVADAGALPLAAASVDLVVAFMSLQDADDLTAAIAECARVLDAGGRLCLAIVHPLNSAGRFAGDEPDSPFVVEGSYLDERRTRDELVRGDLAMTFHSEHRPLRRYVDELGAGGFLVELLREHGMPGWSIDTRRRERWTRIPLFLHIRAVLGGPRDPC
jgi:SAM-dependent methyltransferase